MSSVSSTKEPPECSTRGNASRVDSLLGSCGDNGKGKQLVPLEQHQEIPPLPQPPPFLPLSNSVQPFSRHITPIPPPRYITYDGGLHTGLDTMPSFAPSDRYPRTFSSEPKGNGFWNPYHPASITVHLKMPVQEDLDECLEEFCRLRRLGDFVSARRFFAENLQDHFSKPYILVEYAEMLLEQGDYNTLSSINTGTIFNTMDNDTSKNRDGYLLRSYWELMQKIVAFHKADAHSNDSPIMEDQSINVGRFYHIISDKAFSGKLNSTEVKICSLSAYIPEALRELCSPLFPSLEYRVLYSTLLRLGRIWDLYDITQSRIINRNIDVTKDWNSYPTIQGRIQTFINDWLSAVKGYDASTTLALLSILVSYVQDRLMAFGLRSPLFGDESDELFEYVVNQSTSLAVSIMENDPNSMKSRPFMRWMLVKSYSTLPDQPQIQQGHFDSLPGMTFHASYYPLPEYVPAKAENPGWNVNQVAPNLIAPVETVVKTSRILGDHRTEAMALQWLILLSAKPTQEYKELSSLQHETQGDVLDYTKTLVSRYLICDTETSRSDLRREISEHLSNPLSHTCIGSHQIWALWMLQYVLENDGLAAKRALEEADAIYIGFREVDKEAIDEKLHIGQRLSLEANNYQSLHSNEEELQDEEDRLNLEQAIIDAKRKHWKAEKNSRISNNQSPSDFMVITKPHMLEGKKMSISFEDVENPSDKKEMSYQLDNSKGSVKGPKAFNRYQIEPQGHGRGMEAVKINQGVSLRAEEQSRDDGEYHDAVSKEESIDGRIGDSEHRVRYTDPLGLVPDELSEKLSKAERVLYLLEDELVREAQYTAPGKVGEMENRRKYLRIAIEDKWKEVQRMRDKMKFEAQTDSWDTAYSSLSDTEVLSNIHARTPHDEASETTSENTDSKEQLDEDTQAAEYGYPALNGTDDGIVVYENKGRKFTDDGPRANKQAQKIESTRSVEDGTCGGKLKDTRSPRS
ncbi:hypothetical protein F4814DRAFT_460639 [Daldinia grandis]|nr:hypothetical protein F4814DRAFT_460639 [Daldinia grandis]